MPDPKDRKRQAPISYRPPAGREAEFFERVASSGLSTNAFITDRIFRFRRGTATKAELALLLSHAAEIRDHLHEIADGSASPGAPDIELAARELAVLRAALLKAMERQP